LRAVRLQPAFVAEAGATAMGSAAELLDEASLWLSPAAMARLGTRKGDRLRLVAGTGEREYRVAGAAPGLHAGGELAVLDIAAAQAISGASARSPASSCACARRRCARVPRPTRGAMPAGVVVSVAASVSARATDITRAYRVNLDALSLVRLGTGAFLVFSTLALQAARRRQELALLRALGATRKGITALLAVEAPPWARPAQWWARRSASPQAARSSIGRARTSALDSSAARAPHSPGSRGPRRHRAARHRHVGCRGDLGGARREPRRRRRGAAGSAPWTCPMTRAMPASSAWGSSPFGVPLCSRRRSRVCRWGLCRHRLVARGARV
jgi:hypothetical protein